MWYSRVLNGTLDFLINNQNASEILTFLSNVCGIKFAQQSALDKAVLADNSISAHHAMA